MTILLLGSGGREHALAHKIVHSKHCSKLFTAPGNAGTQNLAENVNINPNDVDAVKDFCLINNDDVVVVGPEDPLVKGIDDLLIDDDLLQHIPVIGASQLGATLEGSKEFAKKFLVQNNIPTAQYESFTKDNREEGLLFLEKLNPPYVLKADGLAAGKGVLIINDLAEAKAELSEMLLNKKFGGASA